MKRLANKGLSRVYFLEVGFDGRFDGDFLTIFFDEVDGLFFAIFFDVAGDFFTVTLTDFGDDVDVDDGVDVVIGSMCE